VELFPCIILISTPCAYLSYTTTTLKQGGLAEAIRVQKTLVSKVMNNSAHFNSDQLYLACQFLKLTENETDFTLLLLEFERCDIAERRSLLKQRIKSIQDRELRPGKVLNSVPSFATTDPNLQRFYLDPIAQLVHAFLIVPRFAADPSLIGLQLGIPPSRLKDSLQLLQDCHFISKGPKSTFKVIEYQTHLASDSQLQPIYQQQARMRSLDKLLKLDPEDKLLFTVLLSIDQSAAEGLRNLILDFLKQARGQTTKSSPEVVYQLTLDFFRWSAK